MSRRPRKPAKSFNSPEESEDRLPFLAWQSRLAKDPQFMPATETDQSTLFLGVIGMTVFVFFSILYHLFFSFHDGNSLPIEKGAVSVYESTAFDVRNQSYLIDINSANEHELRLLPGVGEVMAKKIVAERNANGPFQSFEDVERVHGIGKKTRQKLEPYLAPIAGTGVLVNQSPVQTSFNNGNNS